MAVKSQTPLLIKLMSLLGETNISEQYIEKDGRTAKQSGVDVYGYWDEGTNSLVVNPVPHIVDTLIHELLHKLHPDYSEQTVRSMTGKLMKQLSDAELQAIYDMYKKRLVRDM